MFARRDTRPRICNSGLEIEWGKINFALIAAKLISEGGRIAFKLHVIVKALGLRALNKFRKQLYSVTTK
jgi:hypothetical protein